MDFSLTEEQTLLKESVNRYLADNYGVEKFREYRHQTTQERSAIWQEFAEMGWLALPFDEEYGGFGGSAIDTALIMEEFGRGLVAEPYLASVLLAGKAIAEAGSDEQKERYLPGIVEGSVQAAFAFAEPEARFCRHDIDVRTVKKGEAYVLNGSKALVLNGDAANLLVVAARTEGQRLDTTGISLFAIDADQPGIDRRDYPCVDGHRAAEISFTDVEVPSDALLGEPNKALAVIDKVLDEATIAVSAEAVGIMDALVSATVEYTKTRVQFGRPIGSFQVLQHRMVDMYMEAEETRSLLYMAAMKSAGGGADTSQAVSALKAKVASAGRFVGQEAVQLHGGMGMSDEMGVGHYFKRLTTINTLFGNGDFHLKRYAALSKEAA